MGKFVKRKGLGLVFKAGLEFDFVDVGMRNQESNEEERG
jgi:hypothetical protein